MTSSHYGMAVQNQHLRQRNCCGEAGWWNGFEDLREGDETNRDDGEVMSDEKIHKDQCPLHRHDHKEECSECVDGEVTWEEGRECDACGYPAPLKAYRADFPQARIMLFCKIILIYVIANFMSSPSFLFSSMNLTYSIKGILLYTL